MSARQWVILLVLQVVELVSVAGSVAVLAGMHAWQGMFGNDAGIGWIFSSYLLVSAVGAAVFGRLGDMYGRRRITLLVLALSAAGSVIGMITEDLWVIVASRTVQGAAGVILSLILGIMREHLPADKIPFGVSVTITLAAASSALVLVIAGSLTDQFGAWSIFGFQLVLSAIAFAAVLLLLPPDGARAPAGRINWIGGLLFSLGIAGLLVFITLFGEGRALGATGLVVAPISLVLLVAWYLQERRCANPLIDVRMFASPGVLAANLGYFAISVSIMQALLILAPLLQQSPETGVGFGLSATMMGAFKTPTLIVGMIGSMLAGAIIARSGTRYAIVIACLVGSLACLIPLTFSGSLPLVIVGFSLINFGVSASVAAFSTTMVAITPESRTSEAIGMMAVFRSSGQAIGAQAINSMLALSSVRGNDGHLYPSPSSYHMALLAMAIVAALALLPTLKLQGSIAKRNPGPEAAREAEVTAVT